MLAGTHTRWVGRQLTCPLNFGGYGIVQGKGGFGPMKIKLLQFMRSLGKVIKPIHGGYGNTYCITLTTPKKSVHIQISVFKR